MMSILCIGTDWKKAIKGLVLLAVVVFEIVNQSKKNIRIGDKNYDRKRKVKIGNKSY